MKGFIQKNKKEIHTVINSFAAVLLYLLEKYIIFRLDEFVEIKDGQIIIKIIIGIVLFILFIFGVFCISRIVSWSYGKIFPESIYDDHLREAFIEQKAMFAKRQQVLQDEILGRKNKEIQILQATKNIQFAIDYCYSFFDRSYTDYLNGGVKFEVTFMTLSYKDGRITIPYSCNKEKRQPRSMKKRDKNPSVYEGTETAKIYDEYNSGKKPQMKLIEDTMAEKNYRELYKEQKKRIRSTIVFPVLSHRNELLGTIVVHCNKKKFFKRAQFECLEELMEIFSVDIGYFKILLDHLQKDLKPEDKPF